MLRLNEALRELREQRGLTQIEVAEWLSARYKPTKPRAVSSWETGDAIPNGEYIIYLQYLYHVYDPGQVFLGLQRLNAEGHRKQQEYTRLLMESPRYAVERIRATARALKHYDIPVSAGFGQFMDGEKYEWRDVDSSVDADADYAVQISGNSMEPRFVDKQWIYVREQKTINHGDIGIFLYDGESFCKVWSYDGDVPELLSLNPEYEPIPIMLPETLTVMGKVVG